MAKQMIKRKDGSVSQRGLWDNIRANKGSGKKPTKQMLQQERKIKAKSMQAGGVAGKSPKAGLVDPNGAYTKVQKRNLPPAPMKKGGYLKKAAGGDWLAPAIGAAGLGLGLLLGRKKNKMQQPQQQQEPQMKKGGKIKKAQYGKKISPVGKTASPFTKGPYKPLKNPPSRKKMQEDWSNTEREMTTKKPGASAVRPMKKGGKIKKAQDGAFFDKLSKNKKPQPSSKVMTANEVKKRSVSEKPKVSTPGVINNFQKPGVKISLKKGGKISMMKKMSKKK